MAGIPGQPGVLLRSPLVFFKCRRQFFLAAAYSSFFCTFANMKEARVYNGIERPEFTPERISELKADEVFVFGSNLEGMHGGVETIKPYVDDFISFAREHPELFFYVTRIGCGIAGFKEKEIAPLFADAIGLENVCLPEGFSVR